MGAPVRFRKHADHAHRYDVLVNGATIGTVTGVGWDRPRYWVAQVPGAPALDGRAVGHDTRAAAAETLRGNGASPDAVIAAADDGTLLRTFASLTHRMHAAIDADAKAALRESRDVAQVEILRRMAR